MHDPLFSDDELTRLGFAPYAFGQPADAAVLQADHSEYASLSAEEMPGVALILNGRGSFRLDGSWPRVVTLGAPGAKDLRNDA